MENIYDELMISARPSDFSSHLGGDSWQSINKKVKAKACSSMHLRLKSLKKQERRKSQSETKKLAFKIKLTHSSKQKTATMKPMNNMVLHISDKKSNLELQGEKKEVEKQNKRQDGTHQLEIPQFKCSLKLDYDSKEKPEKRRLFSTIVELNFDKTPAHAKEQCSQKKNSIEKTKAFPHRPLKSHSVAQIKKYLLRIR